MKLVEESPALRCEQRLSLTFGRARSCRCSRTRDWSCWSCASVTCAISFLTVFHQKPEMWVESIGGVEDLISWMTEEVLVSLMRDIIIQQNSMIRCMRADTYSSTRSCLIKECVSCRKSI